MTAMAVGCSHTAGVAIHPVDCYVNVLSNGLDLPILNKGQPGGNAGHIQSTLVQALQNSLRPDFVIAQWPNPFRRTTWYNNTARNENIQRHGNSAVFKHLLQAGDKNFYQPWIDTIIVCNLLCKTAAVPIVNIMIEDVPAEYHRMLAADSIVLHVDKKTPDETWLMDSAASDNLHHSARCHAQWAQRLHGLLNELTTR